MVEVWATADDANITTANENDLHQFTEWIKDVGLHFGTNMKKDKGKLDKQEMNVNW